MLTRDGRSVPVLTGPYPTALPHVQKKAMDEFDLIPGRQRRRAWDPFYNCHGLTFASKMGWVGFNPHESALEVTGQSRKDRIPSDRPIKDWLEGNGFSLRIEIADIRDKPPPSRRHADVGDIILYIDLSKPEGERYEHSGLIVSRERTPTMAAGTEEDVMVLSKLGPGPEYVHAYRELPRYLTYYPWHIQIWSDRGE